MKKKTKKILQRTLITLGVLLALLILDILFWLGPTVKLLVEWIGPKALGTPVTMESLSINPRKGTVQLSGFAIANPDSYGNSNAVAIARLDLAVDMGSLFSSTVTVHRIRIDSPHFVFEQQEASDNIAEFIQSALDFAGYDPDAPVDETAEKKSDPDKKPKIVMVESLNIRDTQFHIAHTADPMLDIEFGIGELNAGMTNGAVQLKELELTNPNRLFAQAIFTLEGIDLLIQPESFHAAPLTVLDLQIHHPHAFAEWAEDASTISEFLRIAESTAARIAAWPIPERREPEAPPEEEPPPAPPPDVRKVSVTDLRFHLVNSVDPLLNMHAGVEKVEADLSKGAISVGRIYITNPRRLALPDLFSMDGIDIALDPDTLYAPPLSLLDVQVRRPHAFLEANRETDTMAELLKIGDAVSGSLPTRMASARAPQPAVQAIPVPPAPPPLELHNLMVDDIQVKLLNSTSTHAPRNPITLAGIGSISVQLVEGKLHIGDLTVPNPSGFQAANLFHLGNLTVAIDPASIFSDRMIIREVFIDSPEIRLEQTEFTGNFAELQKSLLPFVPPGPDRGDPEPGKAPAAAGTPRPVPLAEQPVVLESLLVTNFVINAILPPPPGITNTVAAVTEEEIMLLAFDRLTVEPLRGTLEISNLRLGNPPGFANAFLVELRRLHVALDPDSLLTDILLINKIQIDTPGVTYERRIMTDNFKAFQQTIEGAFARREETIEKAMEEQDTETGKAQKVIIEQLLVQQGTVKAKISALPTASIPLPSIELKEIGREEGGASLADASTRIFTVFYDSIIGVVANTTGIAGDALKGAGAFTFDALEGVTGSLGGFVGMKEKAEDEEAEASEPKPEKKQRRSLFRGRIFHK